MGLLKGFVGKGGKVGRPRNNPNYKTKSNMTFGGRGRRR